MYTCFKCATGLPASVKKHAVELPKDFSASVSLENLKKRETTISSKLPHPSPQIRIKEAISNPSASIVQSPKAEPIKVKGKRIISSPTTSDED